MPRLEPEEVGRVLRAAGLGLALGLFLALLARPADGSHTPRTG